MKRNEALERLATHMSELKKDSVYSISPCLVPPSATQPLLQVTSISW